MMANALNSLLKYSRRRLNQIIIAIHIAKIIGWAGVVGAITVLAARGLGFSGLHLNIWLSFILGGGLMGLINGWWHRLDIKATARWLDEHLNNAEAFSAAFVCWERDCSEPLDDVIVERAETIAEGKNPIDWPMRYMARKARIAGGLLLTTALVIVLWKPSPWLDIHQLFVPKETIEHVSNDPIRTNDRLSRQSARELAQQIFPLISHSGLPKSFVNNGKNSSDLEFVMPGKDARIPLTKMLPGSRRTAEAALTHSGIPSEYDDFVRAYFLELSKEIGGSSPESEGQK